LTVISRIYGTKAQILRTTTRSMHTGAENMQDFRKLKVWERSIEFADLVYAATRRYPREETWVLVSQLKRAVISIPTNIAEGCGRRGGADFLRFLQISMGSACEVECCLDLSRRLGFLDGPAGDRLLAKLVEIKRVLTALIKSLRVAN